MRLLGVSTTHKRLTIFILFVLQISMYGIAGGEEVDVAVDFLAPAKPGRYASYWRLASPSGKKFGQRIWVLIQVTILLPFAPVLASTHSIHTSIF
jgi:hypothetical protein